MLITCDQCNGKGKTHELPPKRCMECKGKGAIEEVENLPTNPKLEVTPGQIIDSFILVPGRVITVTAEAGEHVNIHSEFKKPWYKRILK